MSVKRSLPSPQLLAKLLARLRPHAARQRGRLVLALLGTLGLIGAELAAPWPLLVVVDHVLGGAAAAWLPESLAGAANRERLLWTMGAALLLIAALGAGAAWLREFFGAAAGQRIVMGVREEVHAHVQQLGLDFHLGARQGDLLMRMTGDLTLVRELLVDAVLEIVRHALLLCGMAVVLLRVSPRLGLIALAVVPLLLLLQRLFQRRIHAAAANQRENEAKLAAHAGEMLAAMELVQAYQLEERLGERFHARNRKSLKSGLAGTRLQARLAGSLELALAAGLAATLVVGGREVLAGGLTLGALILLLSYVRSTYRPLRQLSQRLARAAKAAGAATRLLELFDLEPAVVERPDAVALPPVAPIGVRLAGATLRWPSSGAPALQELDLAVAPGRRVLVLGRNGAGKSTLLSLLPRLRDVESGSVQLCGRDVRDWTLASLRGAIGWLPQEPTLFDGTIAENLALGAPLEAPPSDEAIAQAARQAGLARAFGPQADLAEVLARSVGERGRRLSGGQRLRVALARLLLRRPRLLLLDEPEAALDAASRGTVVRELLEALPDATVLLVSHEPVALELFDEAVLLEGGRIVARGAPAEMVQLRDGASGAAGDGVASSDAAAGSLRSLRVRRASS